MTFRPIIERELRGGARRKNTRRLRVWTTVAAIVVAAGFLLFAPALRGAQIGKLLFQILTVYGFALGLFAGVFVTSDCLSEEKRQGTLGLLFLTDLNSRGVVLGKFFARALNPVLTWLAILPVISLALLLGGVTGAEFGRVSLALLNTLFFSLAVGLCVSAFSRDAQRASLAVFAVLVVVIVGAALAPVLVSVTGWSGFRWGCWVSPLFNYQSALAGAGPGASGGFWSSLLVTQALSWLGLGVAICKINTAWQDDANPLEPRRKRHAPRHPRRRVGDNPVSWLLPGGFGLALTTWGIAIAWALIAFTLPLWLRGGANAEVLLIGNKCVGFLLKIIFVGQACHFFIEARRTGAVEMLFCTPITEGEIISAHVRHLFRYFLGPIVVFLLPLTLGILMGRDLGLLSVFFGGGLGWNALAIVGTVTDFLALGALGIWLALSMRQPLLAPGTAVLCVLLASTLLFFIPNIVWDMLVCLWARERLERGFRRRLSEQVDASHLGQDENDAAPGLWKRWRLEFARITHHASHPS